MKKVFALSFSVIFIFTLAIICFAHPGGTDGRGGHYDSSAGEYHYHHGYPAHQHEDSECPYNFKDKTNHSSHSRADDTTNFIKELFLSIWFGIVISFTILCAMNSWIEIPDKALIPIFIVLSVVVAVIGFFVLW